MKGQIQTCSIKNRQWVQPSCQSNTKEESLHAQIPVIFLLIPGTSSGGVYTVDRVADKIDYVHNHIVVLRSGMAAQSQNAAHKVRHLIDSHAIEQGKLPHVRTAARMFQKLNY